MFEDRAKLFYMMTRQIRKNYIFYINVIIYISTQPVCLKSLIHNFKTN